MKNRTQHAASKRRPGFTLIEVMMAVGILTIGAMGLYSMQMAATRGNIEAREMTTATAIANAWAERLRRDALLWNEPGTAEIAGTTYLTNTPAAGLSDWFTPVPASAAESYAFTYLGTDTRNIADARFCTNVQLQWMVSGQAIRADIRVWWPRLGNASDAASTNFQFLTTNCVAGNENAVTTQLAATTMIRAVYVPAILRWGDLQ